MKTLIKGFIVAFSLVIMTGCGAYKQASYVSEQVYIGMTIQEFKKIAGSKARLNSMTNNRTVYKMNDYDAWTGARTDTKFFYFNSNGKLFQIDGGVSRQSRQEIDLNIKNK